MTSIELGIDPTQEIADIPADALRVSWEEVRQRSIELAGQIEDHCLVTGERFDGIVTVPRGGLEVANVVSRVLGFGALDILSASLNSYGSSTTRRATIQEGQMPLPEHVAGKNWIVLDEVWDTGNTMHHLAGRLQKWGAEIVRVGVLHYKPGNSQTPSAPDFFTIETDKWIEYPWEALERQSGSSVVKRVEPHAVRSAA